MKYNFIQKLVLLHIIFSLLGFLILPQICSAENFEEITPQEIKKYLAKFNLELSEATEGFLRLSREDRIKFLFLNDWLMNLQNAYMPWTLQYRSMEEWTTLIQSVGFQEEESHFLGAIKHRKRKQGMTAILTFFWQQKKA